MIARRQHPTRYRPRSTMKHTLAILAVLLISGCAAQIPPTTPPILNGAASNGGASADFDNIIRACQAIKTTEPAELALIGQVVSTAKDGIAKNAATEAALVKANTDAANQKKADDAALAQARSWTTHTAWLTALLGLFCVAASVGLTADGIGVGWAKGVGIAGGVLCIGGSVMAVLLPGLAVVMIWTVAAFAVLAVASVAYLLIKNRNTIFTTKAAVAEVVNDIKPVATSFVQPGKSYTPATQAIVEATTGSKQAALPIPTINAATATVAAAAQVLR